MEILLVVPAIIDWQAKDNHFLIICLLKPNGCFFPSACGHWALWRPSSMLITSRGKSCSKVLFIQQIPGGQDQKPQAAEGEVANSRAWIEATSELLKHGICYKGSEQ